MSSDDPDFDLGLDDPEGDAAPRRYDFSGRPQDDEAPLPSEEPSALEAAILEFIESLQ